LSGPPFINLSGKTTQSEAAEVQQQHCKQNEDHNHVEVL